jgi:acylaminoacyl-peptidase
LEWRNNICNRHWDAYVTEKKNNIFVVQLSKNGDKYEVSGQPINLLKQTGLESPGFPQGDASDYDFSPDASQVAFLSKINTRDNAWQTSAHIYTVSTSGQEAPVPINTDIPAASSSPHYTSSGQLVYFQMYTPQYESDRNRIVLYDPSTKERKIIAEDWDHSPHEVTSSQDAKTLYVTAEEHGRNKIFSIDVASGTITKLTDENYASGLRVLPSGDIFYSSSSMTHPTAPRLLDVSTKEVKELANNQPLSEKLAGISFTEPEDFWFTGALNEKVHGWFLKPANYVEGQKYPLAFLIHGGPQGAWGDSW